MLDEVRLVERGLSREVDPPSYVAAFDSSSGMLRAIGRFLHGLDLPEPDQSHPLLKRILPSLNGLPFRLRQSLYGWAGWASAFPEPALWRVSEEEMGEWMARCHPTRRYPAIALGSASGAAVHLCAALGIPWLPQTLLIPVRRSGVDRDDLRAELEWGRRHAPVLLENNPSLQLHHMADPNQDRLMLRRMSYFRVKRRRLGPALERFIANHLEPGGVLLLIECELAWPSTRVDERHYFQAGGVGGLEPEQYRAGGREVEALLRSSRSPFRTWDPPPPDVDVPESEWGFEPALGRDVAQLARRLGARVRRVVYPGVESLSPFAAELYRYWYGLRGVPVGGLLVESFMLLEPWWTIRTGRLPFWTAFPVEHSARELERYLDAFGSHDHIATLLFSHGALSVGLAPIERWRGLMERAREGHAFLGVDPEAYPADFAVLARYQRAIQRELPERNRMPDPLTLPELDRFVEREGARHDVRWLEDLA